ncbi:MAG: hypothetical protein EPO63_08565 [Candidatus Nitrosotenuis sp.]|nr:MAG: hypothetical protein EPO63_08565 [Candidatus Nitrosotenuis sp.]
MNRLGLDIGGAFIKYALLPAKGKAVRGIVPFELWKEPGKLAAMLKPLRPKKPYAAAITMTGELCDCFKNRREGVRHIVASAQKVFGSVAVYGVKGGLLSPEEAVRRHREVASANWPLVPRRLSLLAKNFLMADIGSTTADLTPVRDGVIANNGFTDYARMRHGELLYTGALRTPLPAVAAALTVGGRKVPVAAETFCIMADVHLLLKSIAPRDYACPAPDGGPKTARVAARRLARAFLADDGDIGMAALLAAAREAADAQRAQVVAAARRFDLPVIAAGTGAFILEPAFAAGALTRHPLAAAKDVASLDPSLALACLLKGGV